MANCNHGNPYRSAPDSVIAALPECQAGTGRHKCAICAYNEGLAVAAGKKFSGGPESCSHDEHAPKDMLTALPDDQSEPHRHKCAYTAYRIGLETGQNRAAVAEYQKKTADLDATEAMRLQKIRIGQQIFRRELLKYWRNKCPITGVTDKALLRASHIRPWSKCDNDSDRLNVYNGILLSSLHDAAFDAGLLSFKDDGAPLYSQSLTTTALDLLVKEGTKTVIFSTSHLPFLDWHRTHIFK